MKTNLEHELLQAIFNEMQELKQALQVGDERRVRAKEFCERMGYCERTFWNRVRSGAIKKPFNDGRNSYWLNSYVNSVVCEMEVAA